MEAASQAVGLVIGGDAVELRVLLIIRHGQIRSVVGDNRYVDDTSTDTDRAVVKWIIWLQKLYEELTPKVPTLLLADANPLDLGHRLEETCRFCTPEFLLWAVRLRRRRCSTGCVL